MYSILQIWLEIIVSDNVTMFINVILNSNTYENLTVQYIRFIIRYTERPKYCQNVLLL